MTNFTNAIAITGGIATGKSTACAIIKNNGFSVIDADKIAHETLNLCATQIVQIFGAQILTDNIVDRKKLGAVVFGDDKKRKQLENIVHPKIREQIISACKMLEKTNKKYFVDIPLYFETTFYRENLPNSLLIYTTKKIQLTRLMDRDNINETQAKQRMNAQMDIEYKKKQATWIIENDDISRLAIAIEKFLMAL